MRSTGGLRGSMKQDYFSPICRGCHRRSSAAAFRGQLPRRVGHPNMRFPQGQTPFQGPFMSNFEQQAAKIRNQPGFIAALDQSGGSTPKALKLYGIEENTYSGEQAMTDLVHQMRIRIVLSPVLNGDPLRV